MPEINDDSPAYAVVRSCVQFGIKRPEDSVWTKLDQPPTRTTKIVISCYICRPGGLLNPVPTIRMKRCVIDFGEFGKVRLFLGQCPRCSRVFWTQWN